MGKKESNHRPDEAIKPVILPPCPPLKRNSIIFLGEVMKKDKYEICKILVLSLKHITLEENQFLASNTNIYKDDYSYLLNIGGKDWDIQDIKDINQNLLGNRINIINTSNLARKLGCSYVKFDADGPVIEELEFFNW